MTIGMCVMMVVVMVSSLALTQDQEQPSLGDVILDQMLSG